MLDYQNPQESKVLAAASRPHGNATSAIFDPQTAKYRQLYNWIALVTKKPPGSPDSPEPRATIGVAGQPGDLESGSSHTLNSTLGDDEPQSVKRAPRVRAQRPVARRADSNSNRVTGGPSAAANPTETSPTKGHLTEAK